MNETSMADVDCYELLLDGEPTGVIERKKSFVFSLKVFD